MNVPSRRVGRLLRVLVSISLLLGAGSACTSSGAIRPKKLRLYVGEIKEIALRSPADTTRRLLATSENPEVVDVSRQQSVSEGITPTTAPSGPLNFLLKGVTAGTVRVVFSEKPAGLPAQDRVVKTYLVEVVNR